MRRLIPHLSLIGNCLLMSLVWAEPTPLIDTTTIVLNIPDEDLDRFIAYECSLTMWPLTNLQAACQEPDRTRRVKRVIEAALSIGSLGKYNLDSLNATMEVFDN